MNKKVIDLFSGVGGLSLGFRKAGFDIVLANEIDKSIANSYTQNHPETKMINDDITKIDIKNLFSSLEGSVDVVIGGPPCQGFSQKGKRKSINDPRNFLFRYFFEVVKYVKPKFFVIENVPSILTAENGYFKQEIAELFKGIGYNITSTVLNASDYGVPQNRCRAFIVGNEIGVDFKFPEPVDYKVTIWDAISDLNYLNSGEGSHCTAYQLESQTIYQKELRKGAKMLYNHQATNHSSLALAKLALIPPEGNKSALPKSMLTKSIYSGTWCRMQTYAQSVTITTRFDTPSSGQFTHPFLDRAITVREAARIQSFPDEFIFYGNKGSQMKQVGNAVPPLLAFAVARKIKTYLGE
ncbi:MAG: DNA cytosine methyltransferase [Clostridia bacterium]|nr:DNA cytosine methyltransferase [Clostridia bacterium]